MAYVTIVGAAGYTGQETLDRVLAPPRARAVRRRLGLARRQRRDRARPAAQPQRRQARPALHHERRRRSPARRTSRSSASRTRRRPRSSRPRAASWSTSPARTGSTDAAAVRALVRVHAPAARRARRLVVRAPGAVAARRDGSSRTPGCYATAILLALAPRQRRDRPRERRRRRDVGDDRRRPDAEGGHARGRRCSRTSRRTRSAAHQHVPEIAQLLGFPVSFTPHLLPLRRGHHRDLQRPLARGPTCARCSRSTTRRAASSPSCRRASRPSSRASRAPTGPRSASSTTRSPDRTIVVCALDNLGKGAAGQAVQNVNLLFGLPGDRTGLRLAGVLV